MTASESLAVMRDMRSELVELIALHPVEVTLAGRRWVFDSPEEIDAVIAALEEEA